MQSNSLFTVEPRRNELQVTEVPDPGPGEVLVEGRYIAVCSGERERFTGEAFGTEYPCPVGHELSGVVVALGEGVTQLAVGDRVATWVDKARGGTYWIAREEHCVSADEHLTFQELALGEPLTCSYLAVNAPMWGREGQGLDEDVVIVGGTGFMGLAVVEFSALRPHRTCTVVGRRPEALELALTLGATHTVNTTDTPSLREAITDITEGRGPSCIYEVMGIQLGIDLATELTDFEQRLYQKHVEVGYHQTDDGRRVTNSQWLDVCGTPTLRAHFRDPQLIMQGMRSVVSLMRNRKIDPLRYVGRSFALDNAQAAFELAASGRDFRKVLIGIGG